MELESLRNDQPRQHRVLHAPPAGRGAQLNHTEPGARVIAERITRNLQAAPDN